MTKIRILHLTDFHYENTVTSNPIQKRLIDSLIKSLEGEKSKIDFIFFTGDLVNKGTSLDDFNNASDLLLTKISKLLDVPKTNVMICAGNHDVHRGQELDDISVSISKINNNNELDKYITKQDGKSLFASLENFRNYCQFQNQFYKDHLELGDEINEMFSIHGRNKGGVNISITTINSAWRALDSRTDSGNLLYPVHLLKESYEIIKSKDSFKIFLMHHPLSDFKYWNATALESIIFKDYHAMFSGHTHKNRDTIHLTPEIGMYSCSSNATLSTDGESKIGYSIVEINLDNYEVKVFNKIYGGDEDGFLQAETKVSQIPVDEVKRAENNFREKVRNRFDYELSRANGIFLSNNELIEGEDFIHLFTTPRIFEKPKALDDKKSLTKSFSLNDLLLSKKNQILFGKDKSGKTAILYKLLLDSLNSFSIVKILPIYIDCRNYIKASQPLNVVKIISDVYSLNKRNASDLSEKYHIKILLDNFIENDILILDPLNKYLSENENSSVITVAEETLFNNFSNQTINGEELLNRFIWEIGRKEIRLLTNKWPNLSQSKKEALLDKIHKVFDQLNIPSNYWTVSLFIWIFEKNADANFRNNFQLIELYIDNVLGRDKFLANESIYKIDYEDFKTYLGELAFYLITNKEETNYVVSYFDLVNFTESYKKQNRKFVIGVDKVVNLIIDLGLIKKVIEDSYTFRLNGVFEYFLAYYMKDNPEFTYQVIDDGHFYLSFANEFEMCAGFNSKDTDFVKRIYEKTKEIYKPINSNYNFDKVDDHFVHTIQDKLDVDLRLPEILEENIKPISLEDQDVIFDEIIGDEKKVSNVSRKKYYETIEPNSDNLEKSLQILSRVFRNSKLKNQKLEDEIFDFILNSTCSLGFQLMEDIEESSFDFLPDDTSEDELMKMLIQFVPIVIQTFFFDAVAQNNLENIILEKINTLKKNPVGNELKLLILYFSLIDLNLRNNHKYISEIVSLLKIGVLKQTSLIKLYIYLATKVNNNEPLRKIIETNIKKQAISMDDSISIKGLEKGFADISKSKLGRKDK